MNMPSSPDYKSGFVSLFGLPNAGKSSLINAIVERSILPVSSKPQTTRLSVPIVVTRPTFQVIFRDTPGIPSGNKLFDSVLKQGALEALQDPDLVLWVVDALMRPSNADQELRVLLDEYAAKTPRLLVVNKIDRLGGREEKLLDLIDSWKRLSGATVAIPVSVEHRLGIDAIVNEVKKYLPVGPQLYPEDMMVGCEISYWLSDFLREGLLQTYSQEVPHHTFIRVESVNRKKHPSVIEVEIHINRESLKPIILGAGGQAIRRFGTSMRKKLEKLWGEKVYLECRVKVSKKWYNDRTRLKQFGFSVPAER